MPKLKRTLQLRQTNKHHQVYWIAHKCKWDANLKLLIIISAFCVELIIDRAEKFSLVSEIELSHDNSVELAMSHHYNIIQSLLHTDTFRSTCLLAKFSKSRSAVTMIIEDIPTRWYINASGFDCTWSCKKSRKLSLWTIILCRLTQKNYDIDKTG